MPAAHPPPDLPTLPAEFAAAAQLRLTPRADTLWQQIGRAVGWPRLRGARPIDAGAARAAFVACLADLPTPQARALSERLGQTHSLSELWHLRPEIFRQLALYHSQAEAARRLAVIGERFDRRAKPRAPLPPATRPD